MLKNYFTTASRNLLKSKVHSLLNILGLAIGMAACLLILQYVRFEESYDRLHANYENIYRLRYERTDNAGESVRFASCCPPAAARIRGMYPEVENIGRLLQSRASVSFGDIVFLEERVFYAEPETFEVLKFRFVEGDPAVGLAEPNRAFISQSTAVKYFGDRDPIGQTLSVNRKADYQVVGLFEDIPKNSHLKFDILLPWENLAAMMGPEYTEAWGHTGSYTYLTAAPGTDPAAFESKLLDLVEAECPWLKEYEMTIDLKMQPLADIHLTSHFMQEYEPNGSRDTVEILFIIAIFIAVMAWVNFINLSTAGAINRAREVGLRKVVGASRGQLVTQFFFEIFLVNVVAVIGAVLLVTLFLPSFNQLTNMPTGYTLLTQGWLWTTLGLMLVVGVLLSGLYPVLALSSFRPASMLRSRNGDTISGTALRRALIVFQFAVGLVLVIATLTVYGQVAHMQSRDVGFIMDQTLVVRAPRVRDDDYTTRFDTFKETLLARTDIEKISHVTEVPGRQIYWDAGGIFKAGEDINQSKNYQIVGIDYDFADLFEVEFVAGRNFSKQFPTDEQGLIFNETAVEFMGFESAESAVGQQVNYWGEIFTIIGVLKDYHQQSPRVAFEPHIFRFAPYGRGTMGMITMRVNSPDVRSTLATVRTQYDEFFPGNSFDYFFLDDHYRQQYESDQLFGTVTGLFAILALIIIGLGIYGLSLYSVTRATKEIGIRKVLGASIPSILGLLTREFVILIAAANVVAVPVAYFAMNLWLENYACRTEVGATVFILAGVSTLLLALVTVAYQVFKAARANPVDAIQYE